MRNVSFIASNVPAAMLEQIDVCAKDLRMSRSALVRLALERYLSRPLRLEQSGGQEPPVAPAQTPTAAAQSQTAIG